MHKLTASYIIGGASNRKIVECNILSTSLSSRRASLNFKIFNISFLNGSTFRISELLDIFTCRNSVPIRGGRNDHIIYSASSLMENTVTEVVRYESYERDNGVRPDHLIASHVFITVVSNGS